MLAKKKREEEHEDDEEGTNKENKNSGAAALMMRSCVCCLVCLLPFSLLPLSALPSPSPPPTSLSLSSLRVLRRYYDTHQQDYATLFLDEYKKNSNEAWELEHARRRVEAWYNKVVRFLLKGMHACLHVLSGSWAFFL